MRMRVLGRKLSAIACGALCAGTLAVANASPASAEPDGILATTEFGVRLRDEDRNGQCVVNGTAGDTTQWVPEGQWSQPLVIDADNRHLGCQMWFGFNNVDGSLTGFNFYYTYGVSPGGNAGQCPYASGQPKLVPIFPLAFNFPTLMPDPPITIDTDGRAGWCDLTLHATGRTDVVIDVLYEFNGDGGQCKGALAQGWGQSRPVRAGEAPVTIGFDTDNRGGACFLSFQLRHV